MVLERILRTPTMVDIHEKDVVYREAVARGEIRLLPETVERIKRGETEKGDPIQVATIAGIHGVKLTPTLMPLCHPINIESSRIEVEVGEDSVALTATVGGRGKTGVEMEALTAVVTGLLNIWDVVKALEKDRHGQYPHTRITNIQVVSKVKKAIEGSRAA